MRTSSVMALGALIGRHLVDGEKDWKDAALAGILAKNEILDKEGCIRKLVDSKNESDIEELRALIKKEIAQNEKKRQKRVRVQEQEEDHEENYGTGFIAGFKRGWHYFD